MCPQEQREQGRSCRHFGRSHVESLDDEKVKVVLQEKLSERKQLSVEWSRQRPCTFISLSYQQRLSLISLHVNQVVLRSKR